MPQKKYSAGTPPKEAIEFFRSKGWKAGFNYQDVWKEEHAFAFTAAKAMTVDVIETLRDGVDRALAEGRTFRDFKKDLQPELERLGWWGKSGEIDPKTGKPVAAQLGSPRRLKVIYQTNMRMARSAGKWARIERTKKLLPYLKYSLGPAEKHRPQHVAWSGTILPADDGWWDTHMPPNGWNCKCWVQQLTKSAADAAGGPGERPEDGETEYINPRTGERSMVPNGITPGFDYNPGKVRLEKNLDRFKSKLNSVSTTAADAVHRAWMQPEIFGRWREDPQGNIPVAVMDDETRDLMGARTKTVLLSGWTMNKQDGRHPLMSNGKPTASDGHPEMTNTEYCLLPEFIASGRILKSGNQRLIYFRREGRLYEVVVKTTGNGRENLVESFHIADDGQPDRELKKKGVTEIRKEK